MTDSRWKNLALEVIGCFVSALTPGFFFYLRMEKGGYLKRELTMCEI